MDNVLCSSEPKFNWNFRTEPEDIAHGLGIDMEEKCTLRLSMIHGGHPKDYDRWSQDFSQIHGHTHNVYLTSELAKQVIVAKMMARSSERKISSTFRLFLEAMIMGFPMPQRFPTRRHC